MPVTGAVVTVAKLIAALSDLNPDTPVIVETGTGELLWIEEITLSAMQERYRVDDAVIALPAEFVIVAAGPRIRYEHDKRTRRFQWGKRLRRTREKNSD